MDIQGTATQAFSEGIRQAIALAKKYYLAFALPVVLGLAWGIISRVYLYGGMTALMSSMMTKNPGTQMMANMWHMIFVLMLTMLISIFLWMVAFSGAGLILKHRSEDTKISVDEILSYTGNRLAPLVTGGILFIFLPFIPLLIPVIGLLYLIGFFVYIFLIGKNFGGFFFWAFPVITEGKTATEGFATAKLAALPKRGPFWVALILGFIVTWIAGLFLAFIPYIGYLLIWAVNLLFLLFTGILYYDYSGDSGQASSTPTQ